VALKERGRAPGSDPLDPRNPAAKGDKTGPPEAFQAKASQAAGGVIHINSTGSGTRQGRIRPKRQIRVYITSRREARSPAAG
jgi:hypothetical protein